MELQLKPYPKLLKEMKAHFTKEENAEMVAVITAAEYQYQTLLTIVGSRLYTQLPAVASEAVTTVNEIAEKVAKNWSENEQTI